MPIVWYCCECNFGPFNLDLYSSCINCNAKHCYRCPQEKISDALNAHSNSHCCHETSPYPSAVNINAPNTFSLDTKPMLPAGTNLPQVRSLRPGLTAPPPTFPSSGVPIQTHGAYLYICCKCGDGPKVWDVQPQCICCEHSACSSCTYVKWNPKLKFVFW